LVDTCDTPLRIKFFFLHHPTSTLPSGSPFLLLSLLAKNRIIGNASSRFRGTASSPLRHCTYPTSSNVPLVLTTPLLLLINPLAPPSSNTGVLTFAPLTSTPEAGSGAPIETTPPNSTSAPSALAVARTASHPALSESQDQDLLSVESTARDQDVLDDVLGEQGVDLGESRIGVYGSGVGVGVGVGF
jgi:hypothetical protein